MLLTYKENVHSTQMYIPLNPLFSRHKGIGVQFTDEPTGALDSKSSHDLLECLKLVNENGQATILMVTHDAFSASYAKEVYILSDGAIKCKLAKGQSRKEFYDRIIDMQASMGSDFS